MKSRVCYVCDDMNSLFEDFMTTTPRASVKLQRLAALIRSDRSRKQIPWVIYLVKSDSDVEHMLSSYLNSCNRYFRDAGVDVNWAAFKINDALEVEIFHQDWEPAETWAFTDDFLFKVWTHLDRFPLLK